ncbi:MAG: succinylglutamate desuccinylase/aspartoacylase family protein [Burkholderiales bacterium]|uniref:Succinylglutamate desuccinylase/aspartoacylase family protein n=1 Tax=Ottowia pentelensis TaxID=511108 RepID=A0ABV6PMQ7_9BURK|nr:succinylglutamate desuccinylase/aspartoacylase family protein [Ottowia sp.]MBN9403874.1 succinylglutamate desuccinylase/aspartoacylase family protein [Burkholderiales bacterium]MBS0403440.1 succinylglutamate desuccinylase/aspartoacylase family protein [Pseudomonadota bacterium]HMN56465.1 succinylglutamate desuccinylase/aspartoacylase family protein [Ottowia sp.]
MKLKDTRLEVLPRDLSAYRAGNTGIDYVHRFDSGRPGPHVLINALTHGNEICGMVAATHLLDTGVRPLIGTLTVSFAHVQAYEAFQAEDPFANRQLVHNLNRVWSADWLDGAEDSPELRRARALRPVVAAADHILDIHSTSHDGGPFWVYPGFERNARAALAIGARGAVVTHLVMPSGLGSGTPLIQHGRHGLAGGGAGVALVVECGQHFLRASAEVATRTALDFLAHFGLIDAPAPASQPATQRRFELLRTCMVQTEAFRFVRPLQGFETFAQGELIATDGEAGEIRAPCDECTVFMPTRKPIVGREAVYLTQPLAA